jgi:hypothetical protein
MCAITVLNSWSRGADPLAAEARLKLARYESRKGRPAIDVIAEPSARPSKEDARTSLRDFRRVADEYVPQHDFPPDTHKALRAFLANDLLVGFVAAGRFVDAKASLTSIRQSGLLPG